MNLKRCAFCCDTVNETFGVKMYDRRVVSACKKCRELIADADSFTNLEVRAR